MTNVTFASKTKLISNEPISHFFHRKIDQIKKLNSFDDCPFLLEFQKKESMPSFNYISARLNDGSSKLSH